MKTSIIMPCCNALDYTNLALKSLMMHTRDYELIIVDNGDKERVPDLWPDVTIIQNEGNNGYPGSMNQGMEIATGDYICVVNNDLVFPPNWLDHLIAHLEHGRLDMIGPVCNSISGVQQKIADVYNSEEEFYDVANQWYMNKQGDHYRFYRLVGFCLIFKRKIYDKIGGFNEVFNPGNFEDDDYCLRAIQAGYRLGIASDVYLHHFGSITHKSLDMDYVALLKRNQKIFNDMWRPEVVKDLALKNSEVGYGPEKG